MPKTKDGEKITWKEFFSRWKAGIDGITPLQKMRSQILATKIQLIGILMGLFVSIYGFRNLWWVGIILIGALINTVIQYLGLRQNKKALQEHEDSCEEMSIDDLLNTDEEIMLTDGEEVGVSDFGLEDKDIIEEKELDAQEILDELNTGIKDKNDNTHK